MHTPLRENFSLRLIILAVTLLPVHQLHAEVGLEGEWIINYELSDDTDAGVEKAIRDAGGRPSGGNRGSKERYRGGPEDQQLYDHISYDTKLQFDYEEPRFRLVYNDGFERIFYSDGRGRVASASGASSGDRNDYSFASWDGDRLLVESRPLDGGRITETFMLEEGGNRLRVELELQPLSFRVPIYLIRIYDRVNIAPQPQEGSLEGSTGRP